MKVYLKCEWCGGIAENNKEEGKLSLVEHKIVGENK